jgi:ankyrin repeat protein
VQFGELVVAQHRVLAKAGVTREVVEAELHQMKFERVLERHPTPGQSFLDACVMGIVDLFDEFAAPGEGVSRLLVDAVEKGQGGVVGTLLQACTNPNYRTKAGETPLYVAATKGSAAIARSLLKAGANVNKAANNCGWTPMHIAARHGHVETVQVLLNAGADANKATENGVTPIYNAAGKGRDETVQVVLNAGDDANKATQNGWTPMQIAARNGHVETVQVLLTAGAGAECRAQGSREPHPQRDVAGPERQ